MIGSGIVEIDRALDEPQAERAAVEVQVARRIAGDRRDVMQAVHAGVSRFL